MKKYLPIYVYGSIIILAGVILFFSEASTFSVMKFTLGIALTVGSIFAFITVFSKRKKQVQFAYHQIHALAMLIYGVSIIFLCNSFETLITFTSFLLIFYAFSEIIFCNWLFNLAQKTVLKIAVIRILLGLIVGIGAITVMSYTEFRPQIFGGLFILVGINILLYVPVMKISQSIKASAELEK